jgi:UDP-glucuronate decarboxylase
MNPIAAEDFESIASTALDWARFEKKTVLIVGAAGFLPAYMVETLLHLNDTRGLRCRVIGLVRNLPRARERFSVHAKRGDLVLVGGDVCAAPSVLTERSDFIIHAASQASPKFYGTDPVGTITANVIGSFHLLNLARQWESEGFLYFSSGEVYGQVGADKVPTRESDYGYIDILNSRSCYAEGKRAAETMLVSYFRQFGVPGTIVRPFHTYGPGMALNDGRVFADFVADVAHRRNLVLHSDGKAVRAFCYLADAVKGFFTVLLKGERGQAYNVGDPAGTTSIAGLAELLAGLYPDLKLKVEYRARSDANYQPSPITINVPNVDRLRALGWQPRFSLAEGFDRTIRSFSPS